MKPKLIVGVFDTPQRLVDAVKAARAEGLHVHDAYTPFPLHGLDHAMNLPPSPLSKYCLRFGLTGLTLTLGFQYWVSLYDWPMNIGGKSFNASPALLPIAFELTVLFAGIGSVISFLSMRKLWPGKAPDLTSFGGLDDRFVLALKADEGEDAGRLEKFLLAHGAARAQEARLS